VTVFVEIEGRLARGAQCYIQAPASDFRLEGFWAMALNSSPYQRSGKFFVAHRGVDAGYAFTLLLRAVSII